MSTDTDLEHLLRDTLDGRARTMTSAPEWHGAGKRSRGPWIAGAAVAACAAAAAVTAGVLLAPGDRSTRPASTGLHPTCTVDSAVAASLLDRGHDLTYDGKPVSPVATTPGGAALGEVSLAGNAYELVEVPTTGTARRLLTVPGNRMITRVDADDRYVAVTTSPNVSGNGDGATPIDRITVLDLDTGTSRELLTDLPAGYPSHPIGGRGAVLQSGVVYWAAATNPYATSGRVLSYDVRSRHYAQVGTTSTIEVDRDVRGVGWPGGSVRAAGAPDGLPAFFTRGQWYLPVYSDGRDVAWQDGSGATIRYVDADGLVTAFSGHPIADRGSFDADIDAVAGPFVFLSLNDSDDGTYLLDTRSGAIAHVGAYVVVTYPSFVTHGAVYLRDDATRRTVRLDTADLPALHC